MDREVTLREIVFFFRSDAIIVCRSESLITDTWLKLFVIETIITTIIVSHKSNEDHYLTNYILFILRDVFRNKIALVQSSIANRLIGSSFYISVYHQSHVRYSRFSVTCLDKGHENVLTVAQLLLFRIN